MCFKHILSKNSNQFCIRCGNFVELIIKLTEFDGKKIFESEVIIDFREGLKKTIDDIKHEKA